MKHMLKETQVLRSHAFSTGTSSANTVGNVISMAGFDSAQIRCYVASATNVITVSLLGSTSTGSFAALFGQTAAGAVTTDTPLSVTSSGPGILILDAPLVGVHNSHIQVQVNATGTANAAVVSVDLYGAKACPTSNTSTDVVDSTHVTFARTT